MVCVAVYLIYYGILDQGKGNVIELCLVVFRKPDVVLGIEPGLAMCSALTPVLSSSYNEVLQVILIYIEFSISFLTQKVKYGLSYLFSDCFDHFDCQQYSLTCERLSCLDTVTEH